MVKQTKPRPLDRVLLRLTLLRLFLPSLVLTFLLLGLTGYLWGRILGPRQLQLARSLAHTVDDYLEHASRVLGAVAQVAEATAPQDLAPYMQATWQSYGYFDTLYWLDESGRVTLLAPPDPRYQGLDMSHQPYFRQAGGQTGVVLSEPSASLRTGQLVVYMAWPLAGDGMLVGELNLGELHDAIAAVGGEQYTVFVADRSGTLLAHPQPGLVAQQVNVGDLKIVQRGLTGEATLPYVADGTFVLSSATQTERTGWIVVAQTPFSTVYGSYVWAMIIAFLLAPTVWLVEILHLRQQLERNVVAPLARLSQGVKAMTAGDFAPGAALTAIQPAFAEVGELAADFAHMSQAVQARQAALQAGEERLRSIVQTATEAIVTVDSHGHIVFWNRAAESVFGYLADEAFGKPLTTMMPERFHEDYQNLVERATEPSLARKTIEMAGLRKDGREFPLEFSWATWETGGETFLTGVVRDITERKRAEESLARHNRELTLLNRASQAFSSTLDLDQVLATVLEEVRRLLGATASSIWLQDPETGGLVCRQATGPQKETVRGWRLAPGEGIAGWVVHHGESLVVPDVQANGRYFREVAEQIGLGLRSMLVVPLQVKQNVIGVLQVLDTEAGRFETKDLSLVESLATTAAIAIENARLYRELRSHADLLEQRVRERTAELQAQYARLAAILSSASDGIIVADGEGQILQANPVAQAWLTQTLSPEDAARLREAVCNLAVRAEERPEETLELKGLDLELSAAPVMEKGMKEPTAVVAAHDVSHLKALDRMKTRFVSNVSHELRTPIATIKLYAELMRRKPEGWKEYLATLIQEADRQARLIQDILQISHIDTGRLEMKPQPTPLNKLTEVTTAGHLVLAQEEGLTLEHKPTEPGPVALVDSRRMLQVLNNLVENAIHYTPEGGKVTVSTGEEEADGRVWATATVTDTGMGIPQAELSHIFERFFRGKEVRLMQIPGTGLGLAIVQEIVELHGGRVTVESQLGRGTTFTIWLPLADQASR